MSDTMTPLFLCDASAGLGEAVADLLTGLDHVTQVDDLAALEAALQDESGAGGIVLCASALGVLSARITQAPSVAPAAVLQDWTEQARAILGFHARHRRDCTLLDVHAALLYPEVCANRLNLSVETGVALAALPRPQMDPVNLALAQAAYQKDMTAKQTTRSLLAAAINLSNTVPDLEKIDLEGAFHHYAAFRARFDALQVELESEHVALADAIAARDTTKKELAAREQALALFAQRLKTAKSAHEDSALDLRRELDGVKQKLAAEKSAHRKSVSGLQAARGSIEALEKEVRTLTLDLEQRRQEVSELGFDRSTLNSTVAAQQAQLDEARARADTVSQALDSQQAANATLEARIADMTSASERMTAELKAVQTAHADALLDLENRYLKYSEVSTQLEEATQQLQLLDARVRTAEGEKSELSDRLARAEHMLQGIQASRSYRIMAPVRRLRAAFIRRGSS